MRERSMLSIWWRIFVGKFHTYKTSVTKYFLAIHLNFVPVRAISHSKPIWKNEWFWISIAKAKIWMKMKAKRSLCEWWWQRWNEIHVQSIIISFLFFVSLKITCDMRIWMATTNVCYEIPWEFNTNLARNDNV